MPPYDETIIEKAQNSIDSEIESLVQLRNSLDENYLDACKLLHKCKGRLVLTGIGKSALVAKKIVATFNSTGTPSMYMHAGDAVHGDMGMVTEDDVVICLSKSGETAELKLILPYLKSKEVSVIGITSNQNSFLFRESSVVLLIPNSEEADPNNLAPTSSTTSMMVLGDALAISLLSIRGFSPKDFASFHPGGSLGKQLFLKVNDLYKKNARPWVDINDGIRETILEMTSKRLGATAVIKENKVIGIITDGDLRRMLQSEKDVGGLKAEDIMTSNPISIDPEALAYTAFQLMREKSITQIIVKSSSDEYLGMIHIHDLIKEGFV